MNIMQHWDRMLSRSFSPQQWFVSDERPETHENESGSSEDGGRKMYVYRENDDGTFTVGYWDPGGIWHPESSWGTRREAADRVRWLHGGN